MKSSNNLFKSLLVGIIVGAIVGTVVYITGRFLGMSSAAFGGMIGGIVGAVSVALIRRAQSHPTGSSINRLLLAALLLSGAAASAQAQAFVSASNGVDVGTCPLSAPCRSITYSLVCR